MKKALNILFFLLLLNSTGMVQAYQPESVYEQGLVLVDEGKVLDALDLWLQEWNRFNADSSYQIDPRVGIGFLKVSTEYNIKPTYKVASEFYLQALKSDRVAEFHDDLKDEILAVSFLLYGADKKWWEKAAKKLPDNFGERAVRTWDELDANPVTPYNESLIEFYVRYHEAKRMYSDVDWEDDRKTTYIKYGKPIQIREGTYIPTMGSVRSMIYEFFDARGIEGADIYYSYVEQSLQAYSFNFESWKYEQQEFVFVSKDESIFRERVLSEMVPSRLKRVPNLKSITYTVPRIVPAFFVIYDIYSFMSTKASFLGDQFSEVQSLAAQNFNSPVRTNLMAEMTVSEGMEQRRFKQRAYSRPITNIRDKNSFKMDIEVEQYRFLRPDRNKIELLTLYWTQVSQGDSTLAPTAVPDFQNLAEPSVELRALNVDENSEIAIAYTKSMTSIGSSSRWQDRVFATFQNEEVSYGDSLRHKAIRVVATAPMIRTDRNDTTDIYLGSGQRVYIPEAVYEEQDVLGLSEVIVGYQSEVAPEFRSKLFTFFVPRDNEIPLGKNLFLYMEVYNLDQLGSGEQDYVVKLRVREFRKLRLFDRFGKGGTTLRLNSMNSWEPLELEYETQRLDMGEYELLVEVIHTNSQQSIRKTIPFRIVEP